MSGVCSIPGDKEEKAGFSVVKDFIALTHKKRVMDEGHLERKQ